MMLNLLPKVKLGKKQLTSKKMFKMAAEQNHPAAIENLAILYKLEKKYEDAFKMYEKGKDLNRYSCYRGLAEMYRYGHFVPKDTVKALELYTSAAENNDLVSQYSLGNFYYKGILAAKDRLRAVQWYTKAAERGYLNAQNELGIIFYEEKKFTEARKWFQMAADKGNAFGAYNLGLIYYQGLGTPKDISEAKKWFLVAAERDMHSPNIKWVIFWNMEMMARLILRKPYDGTNLPRFKIMFLPYMLWAGYTMMERGNQKTVRPPRNISSRQRIKTIIWDSTCWE